MGTIAAIIFGACFPAFFFFFGKCVDEMGGATSEFNYDPKYMYDWCIAWSILAGIALLSSWM